MKFNYNDVDLLNAIIQKIVEEKGYSSNAHFVLRVTHDIEDVYSYKKKGIRKEESLYIRLVDNGNCINIENRKQIYKYKDYLKNDIEKFIDKHIEYNKAREWERKRQAEFIEAKKKKWEDNINKLTPELKAFVYVISNVLATHNLCNNQKAYANSLLSYQNQNIFTNNNFL